MEIPKYMMAFITCVAACGIFTASSQAGDNSPTTASRHLINLPTVSQDGVFDPSLADTGPNARAWMSYSTVDPSPQFPSENPRVIATRLAYSDDRGATWKDIGVRVNNFKDFQTNSKNGTWIHEVSSLIHDPTAAPEARWQLYWHHYLIASSDREFKNGWIGYKGAATPEALETAKEIKLFAGSLYNKDNNDSAAATASPVAGPPVIQVDRLHEDINYCLFLTEPAALATTSGTYIALSCFEPESKDAFGMLGLLLGDNPASRVVLLKCESPCHPDQANAWKYVGTILTNKDAEAFGFHNLSAANMHIENNQAYLLTSPVSNTPVASAYNGCLLMSFADLARGVIARDGNGLPIIVERIHGTPNSFNGACAYQPSASASGLMYGEIVFGTKPFFQIYQTARRTPPSMVH